MRQHSILLLVLGWWIGWVGCQQSCARDPEVRRALPVETVPSADSAAPFNSQRFPEDSTSRPAVVVARTPQAVAALPVYPASAPYTIASSAIMIDAKAGAVLFFKNPDVQRPVASTQKLLTALLVAEHGGLDNSVRVVPEDCAVEPTKLGFRPGEIYTKRQLLAAMLVHSCNDAAVCLARNDAGSIASFASLMNAKAAQLGAESSHFVNPNGLPKAGQFSTVSPTRFPPCYAPFNSPAKPPASASTGPTSKASSTNSTRNPPNSAKSSTKKSQTPASNPN